MTNPEIAKALYAALAAQVRRSPARCLLARGDEAEVVAQLLRAVDEVLPE